MTDDQQALARWLPSLLRASHVVELEIRQDKQRVYWFRVQQQTDESLLIAYSEAIPNQARMRADFSWTGRSRVRVLHEGDSSASLGIFIGVRALVLHPLAVSSCAVPSCWRSVPS